MAETEIGVHGAASGGSVPVVPVREGLPSTYRMRAEPHYVDQLTARSGTSPVRLLDVGVIDRINGPAPAAGFIESVRRHGVLQPLLVAARNGRYQVIAGHKRLAAAVATGLREVPCLLQRVDEHEAGVLAAATNVAALDVSAAADATAPAPAVDPLHAVTEALAALSSAAHLLAEGGSALARGVASELVRAEAARALHLLLAARILDNRIGVARSRVPLRQIAERAVRTALPECQLRHLEIRPEVEAVRADVFGDEELLAHALTGLLLATAAVMPPHHAMTMTVFSPSRTDAPITVTVAQRAVTVPETWLTRAFDEGWPEGAAPSETAVLLPAVRRVADLHEGWTRATATATGTELSMALPRASRD